MSFMLKRKAVVAAGLAWLALAPAWAAAATVKGVRLWRAPDHTRLVFDLSAAVDHRVFSLSAPDRLVVDVDSTVFAADLSQVDFSSTPIAQLRHGKRDGSDLRIVLDLKQAVNPRSFVLKKHAENPDRLVIDLYDEQQQVVKTVNQMVHSADAKRDILIAIDAGHGGEDPGAIGARRLREKDVVLQIAKALAALVDAEPGYRAILVRKGDYYIPHRERFGAAREQRADLFISIHADAFKNPKASGASVFALSRRGATSETARYLATKENEADLIGGVGGVSLDDKDEVLAGVLVDLSMTNSLAASLKVGDRVLSQIGKVTKLHQNRVEQANFLVLKSPDVPSILVETGFISNPQEARNLALPAHRQKLARAIFAGLKAHFYDNPPEDSLVAWRKNGGGHIKHTIARGDTLSAIAKKYKVSVDSLKAVNRLNSSDIRIGQILTIPAS